MRPARITFLRSLAALAVAAVAGAVLVTPSASAATPPPAPTSVVQWGDRGVVYLSWTSGGGTTTGFNVYRSTTSTVPLTNPLNGPTPIGRWNYTDTFSLVGGTTYWYVVQSVDGAGGTAQAPAIASRPTASSTNPTPTPTATPTVTSTPTPTPVPGTPALSATSGDAAVTLAWTAGSGTVSSWSLYRSTSASGVVAAGNLRAGNLSASTLTFNDTTVTNGTTYYYVVVATNGGGSTSSNQVTGGPVAPSPSPTPTPTATGGSGALQVINPEMAMSPNRFVMSRMSYDPTPNSMVRVGDPDNNNVLTYYKFNDVSTVQLKNTGGSPMTVTSLAISQPRYFATTKATPFAIAAGATVDVPVRFVFTGGNVFGPDLRQASLTIDATGQAATVVQLAGLWQPGPNRYPGTTWNFEPFLADINAAYGWTTNIGTSGNLSSANRTFAYGDEKLSTRWKAADSTKPVEMQQLAAYNSGGFAQVNWYRYSDTQGCAWQTQASCRSIIYMADGSGTTSSNPRLTSGVFPRPSYDYKIHPFSPGTTVFGFQVAGEFSDDSRNDPTYDLSYHGCASATVCGHHLRFFPVKTAAGTTPNTWLVAVDQGGINLDYNDNVYVVTNLAPAS